ncbi:MAG: hypothetical protein R3B99_10525 [Polyangiales bacterium]
MRASSPNGCLGALVTACRARLPANDEEALEALEAFVPADVALGRRAASGPARARAGRAIPATATLPTVVLAERDALRAAGSDRRGVGGARANFAAQLGGAA